LPRSTTMVISSGVGGCSDRPILLDREKPHRVWIAHLIHDSERYLMDLWI
jgi:hypothetical protein